MAPACFPSLEINDWVGSHENGRLMGRTRMPNLWIWIQAVTACTSLRRDICREGVPGTHSLCNHKDISLSLSLVDCTGMNYIRAPRFPSLLLSRGLEQARISLPCVSLCFSMTPLLPLVFPGIRLAQHTRHSWALVSAPPLRWRKETRESHHAKSLLSFFHGNFFPLPDWFRFVSGRLSLFFWHNQSSS